MAVPVAHHEAVAFWEEQRMARLVEAAALAGVSPELFCSMQPEDARPWLERATGRPAKDDQVAAFLIAMAPLVKG